jgi:hypothetical protein
VIAEPLLAGAVNGIETVEALDDVTVPIIPAAGAAAAYGVIEFEALDEELVPAPFVAVIENVYAWP